MLAYTVMERSHPLDKNKFVNDTPFSRVTSARAGFILFFRGRAACLRGGKEGEYQESIVERAPGRKRARDPLSHSLLATLTWNS